ncbi:hypothetical protein HMI48_10455 [Acidithiobacillus ferrooxidans]|uniref:hypothetical protein n=1 Tax=Acidithiobacillus ferrooxidans TaxID=920 RepID=UPI001C07A4E8|nr:hypothetical protein [Acidithiobacillus ferrooxidans]MBU2774283.1 hypothetical protein [Acidithiobacillus ferrooxidans]
MARKTVFHKELTPIYIAGFMALMAYGIGYVLLQPHIATVPRHGSLPFYVIAIRLICGFAVILGAWFSFFLGRWLRDVYRAAKVEARKSIETEKDVH